MLISQLAQEPKVLHIESCSKDGLHLAKSLFTHNIDSKLLAIYYLIRLTAPIEPPNTTPVPLAQTTDLTDSARGPSRLNQLIAFTCLPSS